MLVYARHHYPASAFEKFETLDIKVANIIKIGDSWSAVLYKNGHQYDIIPITLEDLIPPKTEKVYA
jgi:hypothetical protein